MQDEAVEDMVASVFQRLRKRKQKHLPKVQVNSGLPLVHCNMVLVEQVLDNLIDNAIRHSGAPDSVALKVLPGEDEICFQVSDAGQGMQTVIPGQGDQFRGMGIGLRLCHAVAKIHHGRLDFSRGSETGTVASFCLPVTVNKK